MPCVIIISNGSTAELNIVSELSLAPCMAPFLTTKHSLQLGKGAEGLGRVPVSLALAAGLRLLRLCRATNFAARKISSENVVYK